MRHINTPSSRSCRPDTHILPASAGRYGLYTQKHYLPHLVGIGYTHRHYLPHLEGMGYTHIHYLIWRVQVIHTETVPPSSGRYRLYTHTLPPSSGMYGLYTQTYPPHLVGMGYTHRHTSLIWQVWVIPETYTPRLYTEILPSSSCRYMPNTYTTPLSGDQKAVE